MNECGQCRRLATGGVGIGGAEGAGLPTADNLRQNVSSFEEAVPPRTVHPRNIQVESDERHAIELKLKYMSQRQLQNAKEKKEIQKKIAFVIICNLFTNMCR